MKENEKRRKRLEDLRLRMTDESSGGMSLGMDDLRLYHDSDTDDEMLNTPGEEDSDSSNGKSPRLTDAKESTSTSPLITNASENFNKKSQDYSDNITTSFPEKEKPNKEIPHILVTSEDLAKNSCIPGSEVIVDTLLSESQVCDDKNEPDIVRSTKTKTPPTTLLDGASSEQPKAPPRRKKKGDRSSVEVSFEFMHMHVLMPVVYDGTSSY